MHHCKQPAGNSVIKAEMANMAEGTGFEPLTLQEVLSDVDVEEQNSSNLGRTRRWTGVLVGFSASLLVGFLLHRSGVQHIWQKDMNSFVDLAAATPEDWSDFGAGTVCRADDKGGQLGNLGRHDPGYGMSAFGSIATVDACKQKCETDFANGKACYGIEYQTSRKYCEIWRIPILYTLNKTAANLKYGTKEATDFQCSTYIPGNEEVASAHCKNETDFNNLTDPTNPCRELHEAAAPAPSPPPGAPPAPAAPPPAPAPPPTPIPPFSRRLTQTPAEALAACVATEKLRCCLSTTLNNAARADCCADPAHKLADRGRCLPCTATGASCKLSGHCCDSAAKCYHTIGAEAQCLQTCMAPNSCHLFGKCATAMSLKNCHGVPYEGNCCDPWLKCYFLDANRTESQCMATCDDVRQNVGEGGKLCEEVVAVPLS